MRSLLEESEQQRRRQLVRQLIALDKSSKRFNRRPTMVVPKEIAKDYARLQPTTRAVTSQRELVTALRRMRELGLARRSVGTECESSYLQTSESGAVVTALGNRFVFVVRLRFVCV